MYELCDLLAKEFPPTPSLVGDKLVIPGGVAILAAQPKVGKSYLVMQLALVRAYDRPWIGFSTTPGRTLYINTEIVEVECQARFRQLTARGGHPLRGAVHVATLLGHALNRPEDFDLIAGHIERTDVDLIIIDCLSSFLDGDESSQEHIKPFLQAVNQLRARYGVAVLVVHHHRKPPRESKGKFSPTAHDMSGSGLLFRWPDTVITAEKLTDGVKLSFDTRHAAAPEPFKVVRGPDL
jgi:RecA-family ATPase